MSFFLVRLDELGQLRTQLRRCSEDLRSAAAEARQASPGSLGTPGLDSACGEYGDAWGYGFDQFAEGSDRIEQGMGRAQEAYAGADEAVARMYSKAMSDGGGGASGGGHG